MNRLQPRELEERTDVSDTAHGLEDGLTVVEQRVGNAVEDAGDTTHAEEPEFWRRSGAIHEPIDSVFEGLVPGFEHVLVLMMGLTAPQSNPEKVKAVREFCTGMIASVITEEVVWRSPFANKRLEGPDEGFGPRDGLNMNNVGPPAKKDLRLRVTSVKRGRVSGHFVSERSLSRQNTSSAGLGVCHRLKRSPPGDVGMSPICVEFKNVR